jgi:hypothetical protein
MATEENTSAESSGTPDGSTNITEEEKTRTENLPDGSSSGNAVEDPEQDSDIDSGGEPEGN